VKGFLARHAGVLTVLGVPLAVLTMLAVRLAAQPMPRYGGGAAHYIEHAYRVERVALWRSRTWGDLMEFLVAADIPEGFPPMLHALAGAVGGLVGHSVQDQLFMGPVWLALLAGSVAWTALTLTGARDVAGAALVGTFLLPAAQGMALRYYYDLPAAAVLWLALAVFAAGQDRWPGVPAAVAGALVWVAGCIKWSMLPYAALTFPFVVLSAGPSGPRRLGRRAVSLGIAATVASALLWAWMEGGGGSHNETLASRSSSTGPWEERVRFLPLVLQAVAARGMWEVTHPDLVKMLWYPLAALVSILSPLWAASLLPGLVAALRARSPGWLLGLGGALGIGAFLTFMIAVRDERFTVAAAAAVVLLAAVGWGELPEPRRARMARAVVIVGLLVSLDFHFAPRAFWNHELRVYPGRDESEFDAGLPPLSLRGLGLSDSVESRGWSRRDTTPDSDLAYLEEVWASIERCGGPAIALSAHVLPNGSTMWLRYRALLSFLRGEGWQDPEIDVQWAMPDSPDGGDAPPPPDPADDHPPTGDTPPPPPPAAVPHVGIAHLSGRGLPGAGWQLVSRHTHPELVDADMAGEIAIGIFARAPARCLPAAATPDPAGAAP
jgi:hypothetical protein